MKLAKFDPLVCEMAHAERRAVIVPPANSAPCVKSVLKALNTSEHGDVPKIYRSLGLTEKQVNNLYTPEQAKKIRAVAQRLRRKYPNEKVMAKRNLAKSRRQMIWADYKANPKPMIVLAEQHECSTWLVQQSLIQGRKGLFD